VIPQSGTPRQNTSKIKTKNGMRLMTVTRKKVVDSTAMKLSQIIESIGMNKEWSPPSKIRVIVAHAGLSSQLEPWKRHTQSKGTH
jgi:hypothetical protein